MRRAELRENVWLLKCDNVMFRASSNGPGQRQRLEFKWAQQNAPETCRPAGPGTRRRRRPTGSRWAKRKGGAGWTAVASPLASLASCCSSIRSTTSSSNGSGRPSRLAFLKATPTRIGLDKARVGGTQLRLGRDRLAVGILPPAQQGFRSIL